MRYTRQRWIPTYRYLSFTQVCVTPLFVTHGLAHSCPPCHICHITWHELSAKQICVCCYDNLSTRHGTSSLPNKCVPHSSAWQETCSLSTEPCVYVKQMWTMRDESIPTHRIQPSTVFILYDKQLLTTPGLMSRSQVLPHNILPYHEGVDW